jgi:tetratricopeptide (TPR) repeat protein/transglutaminase-like putative cysteine protease
MISESSRIATASAAVFLFLALTLPARAQQASPAKTSAGFSDEPFVIERSSAEFNFEKDGTSNQVTHVRVRIQSQAGLQQFGLVRVGYPSAVSTLEIVSVRVLKADGRVVLTPAENVLEMPAEITRQAPFYSDLKEKQVAVKGLEIGDTLEYEYREHVHTPLDPGHFWLAYNFFKDGIILDESLQISVPRESYVKVQSKNHAPMISEQGAYRVYSWKVANLESPHKDQKARPKANNEPDVPAVQLTTFRSWDEVADWFRSLVSPRVTPTPEIRAKAEELTRAASSDAQKVQAVYDYVSTKFRYIGVSLGVGRYQPHAASEVLTNDYGDCKDKHTLLASLLSAVGVKVYPALVNTTMKIDPETPSPGQFNHVVSVVPQQQGFQWLDTTPEVAPLGYVIPDLREKEALVIPESGPARLVQIPAGLPFQSILDFQMQGTLDDQGTFKGKAELVTRGDFEILLRSALRSAPQTRWKEVVQSVSASLGFGGDVSDVSADAPDSTHVPLHVRYEYTRKEFGDWPNRRIIPALPIFYLPEPPAESEKDPDPLTLSTLAESRFHCTMKLPKGSDVRPRPSLNLEEAFGTYHSSYSFRAGSLSVERVLQQKVGKILPAQIQAYRRFRKAILDEEVEFLSLNGDDSENTTAVGNPAPMVPPANPEAMSLVNEGTQAMQKGDFHAAADLFRKAVEKDPQFGAGWVLLGVAHVAQGSVKEAVPELKKGIALDHKSATRCKYVARQLETMGMLNDALELWKAIDQAEFDDKDAPVSIGAILMSQKRYTEALPELETGAARNPSSSRAQFLLGQAYLQAGDEQRALSKFQTALQFDSRPELLNNVAYTLAEKNFHLDDALQYAQKAVAAVEKQTTEISLDSLEPKDLRTMIDLGADWDTLGWIYYRLGRLDLAEKYFNAAWSLTQFADIGDHLGQLYERQGKKREAVTAYARAVATGHSPDSSQKRLAALEGSNSLAQRAIEAARGDLGQLRSVKVRDVSSLSGSAEFFLLFGWRSQPPEVRFVSGSETLRAAADALKSAKYDILYPDDAAVKFIRRGIFVCSPPPSGCSFVLIPPDAVRSVN